jgi:superfamily II DNA/RNA helicase
MIAQSQSGTGKTAAFVLAMLSRVDPSKPYPQVTGTFHHNALKMVIAH